MNEYIKEILSENHFYISDRSAASDDFDETIFTEEYNLTKIFNYDTYTEMLESIHKDIYYEKKLNQWIEGKDNHVTSQLPEINSMEAKDAFDESFRHLIKNWHKFTPRSNESSGNIQKYDNPDIDFPFFIFKAIYKRCPQLCINVFPVVIFIIADSFYDFCEIAYSGKKHLLLKALNPQQEEKIYDLFHKIMTQNHKTYYLLSLLNSKGSFYAKSSLRIGEEIFALVFNEYKKHEKEIIEFYHACEIANSSDDVEFETLMEAFAIKDDWSDEPIIENGVKKLKKRFEDNLKKKQNERLSRSSTFPTEIMIGENFLAFLNFLKTQPDNGWKEGVDTAASLYVANHITGWIAIYLLHNSFPPADREYGMSLFNINHLHTLYFITDQIALESDFDEQDVKYHPFCACVECFLSDAEKIYKVASNKFPFNLNENATLNSDLWTIDKMFFEKLNCMKAKKSYTWFNHDRLAEMFAYYIYNQYTANIYISTTDAK